MNIKILPANAKTGFSLLAGINRPVNPSQVTKLAKSIGFMGVIRPIVIATIKFVTGKPIKYIIDGQHLYHALLRAGMDFPYVEITVKDEVDLVEKIALLNASSKSWSMVDYVTAWGAVSNDYITLMKYYNTYDLELCMLAQILSGRSATVGGRNSKIIKDGSFRIQNEAAAIVVLNNITDVLKIVPRMDRKSNALFINIYIERYKGWGAKYDHKLFLNYLTVNKSKFSTVTSDPEHINKLLDKAI